MDKPKFIPIFVRVIGLAPANLGKKPFLELEDPRAIPTCIVSFVYECIIYCGWYSPAHDFFMYQETDDKDPEKDRLIEVPQGSALHEAAVATVDHFRDTLATGGTPNMEEIEYPTWAICPRQQRTQRQSKRTAASTSATSPTPPPASS